MNLRNLDIKGSYKYRAVLGLIFSLIYLSGNVFAQDFPSANQGRIRYVKENGSGTMDGSSWENASADLQAMINASNAGDKVYVTAGTYYAIRGNKVTDEHNLSDVRQYAFVMKSGVAVFGGFDPVAPESDESDRQYQQNARYGWQLKNISLLTGDHPQGVEDSWQLDTIGWRWNPVGYVDNTTHVVWFASNGFSGEIPAGQVSRANALAQEAVLDGFAIEGGYADGCGTDIEGSSSRFGGGVYLVENGVVRNCIIRENYAVTRGGGVFMNYGGKVSDCFVARNSSPGYNYVRNGLGGGIYGVGKGLVERSFVVNNSARQGGGIYLEKENNALPYEVVVEMSVIANNTATSEAGGVYCDSAGVLTGVLIARNNCMDPGLTGNGKTGGLYVDHYAVLTGTIAYGNNASVSRRQGYATNIVAPDVVTKTPASIQIYYSAVEHMAEENFGMATLKEVVNIDDDDMVYAPRFIKDLQTTGILPSTSNPQAYLSLADWDKDPCSVFMLRGASSAEAPFFSEAESKRVNIPTLTIDRKTILRRPDAGPYISDIPAIKHNKLPDGTLVVYVDNQSEVCGDGSSWASPTRLLVPAIKYVEALGGGQVWVKEGRYLPIYSSVGGEPQEYCITMGSNVKVYGGFPKKVTFPGMAERDPVSYRTIIDGEIGLPDDYTDNSYHLILFENTLKGEAVLDGFNLKNANSLAEPLTYGKGGAVLVNSPYAVIRNCIIENCLALDGAAVLATTPFRMENCVVNNNDAREGAVVATIRGTQLINLTVVLNTGVGISGGEIVNSLVWANTGYQGNEDIQITGVGLNDVTYSAVQSGFPGTGNVRLDPDLANGLSHFVNPTRIAGMIREGYGTVNGGEAIMEPNCTALTISKGIQSTAYSSTDIRGVKRGRGGAWDIGAFESTCLPESGVWYVREGGTGDGTSWAKAAGDIQAMVNKAVPGEQVWVAAGTYSHKGPALSESVVVSINGSATKPKNYAYRRRYQNFIMKEGVNVYGGFPNRGTPGMSERQPNDTSGTYRTILQPVVLTQTEISNGFKRGRVLEQSDDFTVITEWDGFTLRDGFIEVDNGNDGGAGVKLEKNGQLVNCYITNNVNEVVVPQYKESKIGNWFSRWELQTIYLRGGGVHCRGGNLINCYITGNEVRTLTNDAHEAYGGGLYIKNGTVYNCVIVNNRCVGQFADGCAAFVEQADFYNNTIAVNKGNGGRITTIRIGGFSSDSEMQMMNCIIWGNDGVAIQDDNGKLTSVTYSFYEGATSGTNRYDANGPGFIDMDQGNFRLSTGSVCINTGNTYPEGITLPETDLDYTERIKDCAIDMGAYEFGEFGEGTILPDLSRPDTAIVYVTQYGRGRANGSSWSKAVCRSKLQRAIDVLAKRKEKVRQVWIGTGKIKNTEENLTMALFYPMKQWNVTEVRNRYFKMRAGVAVMGSFGGWEKTPDERLLSQAPSLTVLSGDFNETPDQITDDAFHVVVFDTLKPGESSLLENVVVRNGLANHHGSEKHQNGGGIVVMPGGNVRNCAVTECRALHHGGGIFLVEKPESIVKQMPGATVTGSLVKNCQATQGGGIYAGRRSLVTNSTIVKNDAKMGGGVAFDWPVAIQGSVLWNNTGENGKDLYGMTNVPFEHGFEVEAPNLPEKVFPVNFSAIEGIIVEGQFNIALAAGNDEDGLSPGFENPVSGTLLNGGWRLKTNSALIDKGLNNVILKISPEEMLDRYFLSSKDIGGNERVHNYFASSKGAYMDIGAYEVNVDVKLQPDKFNRLYVTRSARGKMDGSSWKDATSDLQNALNYFKGSTRKGEVWVQGGYAYVPLRLISNGESDPRAASFVLNPNVSLYGGFMGDTLNDPANGRFSEASPDERPRIDKNGNKIYEEYEFRYATVLDGGINPVAGFEHNAYHVLYYDNNGISEPIVVDGFTIQNGQAVSEGDDSRHKQGGGIFALSPLNIRNCIFLNNYAAYNGGAVYCTGGGKIENCLLGTNGVALGKGGAVYIKDGLVANTTVANNTSQYGVAGGLCAEGGQVINCVIASNNATDAAGVYLNEAELINTIVWRNAVHLEGITEIGGKGVVRYSALPVGRIGETINSINGIELSASNEAADGPRFMQPTLTSVTEAYDWAADWRLHPLSPLTDKGNSDFYTAAGLPQQLDYIQYAGKEGLTAVQRIQGRSIDIGCYENAAVELSDRDTLYVRTQEDPTVLSDGSSWKNATADLQAAIEKLEARPTVSGVRKQIWVAQGKYVPTKYRSEGDMASRSFVISKGGVEIYGGFPDEITGNSDPKMADRRPVNFVTVLDGGPTQSRHIVYGENTAEWLIMDGFTISGGRATGVGNEGRGAAIFLSANAYLCRFNRCIITGNTALGTGGAVYAGSAVYLTNSLVFKNNALGLYTSYGELINNTFVYNTEGGAIVADRSLENPWGMIRNSIFWGNTTLQLSVGNTPVNFCAIQDQDFPGEGNMNLNARNYSKTGPRFKDVTDTTFQGFELGCGSLLRDAGSPEGISVGEYDLTGKNRILSGVVDLGAIESVLGDIPAKPEIAESEIYTCQNVQQYILLPNEVPGTQYYAIVNSWEFPLNDTLIVGAETPGKILYRIVRQDSTGCQSEADSIIAYVYRMDIPADFAGTPKVCEGNDVILTFTPVDGYEYDLFDGDGMLEKTSYRRDGGMITVYQPSLGEHTYRLRAKIIHDATECVSALTPAVTVTVIDRQTSDGSSLELLENINGAGVCHGDEIRIVYKYLNAKLGGAEALGLPSGVNAILDTDVQTITINGKPSATFTYVVKTKGELECAAARATGIVKVSSKPVFDMGN